MVIVASPVIGAAVFVTLLALAYVTGLTQLGIRNVSSTAKEGYDGARRMGSDILSVRHLRKMGVERVLERVPAGKRYYVTIDIDAFDPSIAPGTGTPSHGGFLYYEVLDFSTGRPDAVTSLA